MKFLLPIVSHVKQADAIVKGMRHCRSSNGQKEPNDINAKIKTDLDQGIAKINVAPQDIGRIMLNLISNAVYAVSQRKLKGSQNGEHLEPTVTLKSKKINAGPDYAVGRDKVMVSVTDNGVGIPTKVINKTFLRFFKTKPTGEGTGFGLSLSYDIITKGHDGEIKVDTVEGQGTTFTIVLPV